MLLRRRDLNSATERCMQTASALFLGLVLAACQWPQRELSNKEKINVGLEKQLLFDDTLVESKYGFETTMNPAIRTDVPVLKPQRGWEKYGCTAPTVIAYGDKYHICLLYTSPSPRDRG